MNKTLVIVESPAKAKKISSYLGSEYIVKSSIGHIRDLPVPSKMTAKAKELNNGGFKKFAVDVNNNFEPYYMVSYGKGKTVTELKAALKLSDELLLATDEDREGEAIAWHLLEALKPKVPVKRMVFHEITKEAIEAAVKNTREIDYALVDAQETRRILDRLFGFQVSPLLWRKFGTGLSAGRVQSVTTRLIVDREKERMAFKRASFFDISGIFEQIGGSETSIEAALTHFKGAPVAVAKSFTDLGELKPKAVKDGTLILDKKAADQAKTELIEADFEVIEILKKAYTARPKPPFTTSTLQQAAVNKLHTTSDGCMRAAQSLYENGYITYMRTDSPVLSGEAIAAARSSAETLYGKDSIPEKPRVYSAKSSNAQEAHEAIRPAGSKWATPAQLAGKLDPREHALYDLIYKRTLASQMNDAKGWTTTLKIGADAGKLAVFSAAGTVIDSKGFLAAYDDSGKEQKIIPSVNQGEALDCKEINPAGHETKPPARYTEASLVKKMEELGIGRPSTYAATIRTVQDRGYVLKRGQALQPTWLAFGTNRVLEEALSDYVDYEFTARMEEDLDEIAAGEVDRTGWLKKFWFGEGSDQGLEKETEQLKELIASKNSDDVFQFGESGRYQVRVTAYGPFIEDKQGEPDAEGRLPRGYIPLDERTSEQLAPDELTDEMSAKAVEQGIGLAANGKKLGVNPATGFEIVAVTGKYGPYFTEILPEGTPTKGKGAIKAKTASLLKEMSIETVDLADALKMLQLPRELGENPLDGEKISVNNGRFGPYLMKKDPETKKLDYRSIRKTETETAEERMFSVTYEEAVEEYSHPKIYRRAPRGARRK